MIATRMPSWKGETAVIIASGPSVTDEDLHTVVGVSPKIIGVNAMSEFVPCDVAFGVDFLFWKIARTRHRPGNPACWTTDRAAAERYGLSWVRGVHRPGLGRDKIHTQGNSGMAAINLAYLFGARRILLLGFDMRLGPAGRKHWHTDHPAPLVQHQCFSDWLHKAPALAADLKSAGVAVINCSRETALTVFPRGKLSEELSCCASL